MKEKWKRTPTNYPEDQRCVSRGQNARFWWWLPASNIGISSVWIVVELSCQKKISSAPESISASSGKGWPLINTLASNCIQVRRWKDEQERHTRTPTVVNDSGSLTSGDRLLEDGQVTAVNAECFLDPPRSFCWGQLPNCMGSAEEVGGAGESEVTGVWGLSTLLWLNLYSFI